MLARYLRRAAPHRYALHTPESLRSVPFGLRVKSLVHGLPGAMDDATPQLEQHLGRHMPVAHALTHDFLQTGHPDHLGILLDLLHGEHDVPGPSQPQNGAFGPIHHGTDKLGILTAVLHHLDASQREAAQYPRHVLNQFMPEDVDDEQFNADSLPLEHPSEVLRGLHPWHGGAGLRAIPDLLLQKPRPKNVQAVYPALHNLLFNLYSEMYGRSQRAYR